jgi:hypothetical protein
MSEINDNFNKVCENYPEVKQIENVSLENIKDEIAPILEKFKHIYAALDYK